MLRWGRKEVGVTGGLIVGGLVAVSWWPIVFSRVGLRPIMEPVLLVGAVYWWRNRPVLAGLLLGLSLYTYTAARVLITLPIAMTIGAAIGLWRQRRQGNAGDEWREWLRASLIVSGLTLVIYLPLQLTLWADPTLQERLRQLEGPLQALQAGDWGPVWTATWRTLGIFSVTGDPLWSYGLPNRPVLPLATALLFHIGLILTIIRLRQPKHLLWLLWFGLTLLPAALAPDAPSLIRLIGVLPLAYLLPVIGLKWLSELGSRWHVAGGR